MFSRKTQGPKRK